MNERDKYWLGRREFLTGMTVWGAAAMATECFPGALLAQQAETKEVAEVFLDLNRIHTWDMSNGDTGIRFGRTTAICMPSIVTAAVSARGV